MDYLIVKLNAFQAWYQAGGSGPYWLWLSSGLFCISLVLIVGHRLIRSSLGHQKFRGTWYNGKQYQELLMMTYTDQQKGFRVMRHDELELLRSWELGNSKGFSQAKGMDFRP